MYMKGDKLLILKSVIFKSSQLTTTIGSLYVQDVSSPERVMVVNNKARLIFCHLLQDRETIQDDGPA